jgi:hypothetical protein
MIPYVYAGVDGENEKELLEIVNSYKQRPSDQRLLSEVLTEFIKVMPPAPEATIHEIISNLIKIQDKQILSNLIEPIILLAKVSGEASTVGYLTAILQQADSSILCIALKKYLDLAAVFQEEHL